MHIHFAHGKAQQIVLSSNVPYCTKLTCLQNKKRPGANMAHVDVTEQRFCSNTTDAQQTNALASSQMQNWPTSKH
jgi:hypothetical protein